MALEHGEAGAAVGNDGEPSGAPRSASLAAANGDDLIFTSATIYSLYPGSLYNDVTGSTGSDKLIMFGATETSDAATLTGSVDLGAGGDTFIYQQLASEFGPSIAGTISGGADKDDLLILSDRSRTFDLSQYSSFEDIWVSSPHGTDAELRLVDGSGLASGLMRLRIGRWDDDGTPLAVRVVIAETSLPHTFLQAEGATHITIESTATLWRVGSDLSYVIKAYPSESFTLINNGTILASVQLGLGNDHYDGRLGTDGPAGTYGSVHGYAGDDWIRTGAGNDRIDGGLGADRMEGGAGDDIYVVDDPGDIVSEAKNAGSDEVHSSIGFALSANVERLVLTGAAANGTGNEVANFIQGNGAANVLDGGGGGDEMRGGEGDDTYHVDHVGDVAIDWGVDDNDRVISTASTELQTGIERLDLVGTAAISGRGNLQDNVINGNSAANRLDGWDGADIMTGGAGNDTYVVDESGDQVIEAESAGYDRVESSINYVLGANLEALTLTSAGVIATGNSLANRITGNGADNVLSGGSGNDILSGDGSADTLNGGTGDDRLDGGVYADRMTGGAGHDIYVVDHHADQVIEEGSGGTDTVETARSYTLPTHLEKLVLTGSYGVEGRGNSGANTITGNRGGNLLNGGRGNDFVDGGAGNDQLIGNVGQDILKGGSGDDRFYFNVAPGAGNADEILDFSAAGDSLYLLRSVFTRAGPNGALAPGAFHQGTGAADAGDRILYDAATGGLFYDADGTGAAAPLLFATVDPGTALSHADFVIYG